MASNGNVTCMINSRLNISGKSDYTCIKYIEYIRINRNSCFLKISDISNIGSLRPINNSVYMASERRIDISPVTIYVSGVYACMAENVAGKEMTIFTINVKGRYL